MDVKIRSLTEDDIKEVSLLDDLSDNGVVDMIDCEDYAWGIFVEKELIGYCTVGGADVGDYEDEAEWTYDSLLLSDVFICPEYRGNGYAKLLINYALKQANPDNEPVFLKVLDDRLATLYESLGFKYLHDGTMVNVFSKETQSSLDDKIKIAETCLSDNQPVKEFVFEPRDYEEAKKALLDSKDDSMYWKNDRYICFLECEDNGEIYYDLHLVGTGTVIMYGEVVEFLSDAAGRVNIRVPDSENEFGFISKEFFEKNFTPKTVPEREKIKENSDFER